MSADDLKMKLKIHYHTDCSFFAGCENMLAVFLNSALFHSKFQMSLSYRGSKLYESGFRARVIRMVDCHRLSFPELSDVDFLPTGWPLLFRRFVMSVLRLLLQLPLFLYEFVFLYRVFRRIDPDVLHINNGGYPGALSARAAALAGKCAGIPVKIMVVNNMAVNYSRFSRWQDYPIDFLIARVVDLFVTGSQAANFELEQVLRLPPQKLRCIHNGIPVRERTETARETLSRLIPERMSGITIGVVALLVRRKGHRVLLEAINLLYNNKRLPDGGVTVLIEGEGALLEELLDYVDSRGLSEVVRFVGRESNVINFIAALDVLVLPSIQNEDFPNVILEAMSLAKPVVATKLAGIPEQVLDGETGLLVEPGDVEQMAIAIERIVANEEDRIRMGHSAFERFTAKFTDDASLKNYYSMYLNQINLQ
jgi:glycosyltransferase involved in cell wall biosynthesis